ncbi:MAG: type VII secretion protein EssC [Oliverpabstia sp.]
MFITLFSKERIQTTALPEKIAGQFRLFLPCGGKQVSFLSVEGIDGRWIIKPGRQTLLYNSNGEAKKAIEAQVYAMYPFRLKDNTVKGIVFCEPMTEDRALFRKMAFLSDVTITIGRSPKNNICYGRPFVSSEHAKLTYQQGKWYIEDCHSTNGTFVNSRAVTYTELKTGDMIYILGLKIIVGADYIAYNDPDGKVGINLPQAQKFKMTAMKIQDEEPEDDWDEDQDAGKYYSRSPRFKREVEPPVITIDAPPQNQIGQEMPLALVLGSSVTMGLMSAVMLVSAVVTQNMTSMATGAIMLISTLLLPTITRQYERKQKHRREKLRQEKYTAYLEKIKQEIETTCRKQEAILRENHVTLENCEQRIQNVSRNLWERDISQNDFLRLRLGIGEGKLNAKIQYAGRRFTLDDDNLQEAMLSIGEEEKILHNIPVTLSLLEDYVSGIIGEKKLTVELAKGMIFQIAALYGYDEVKMVFLYDRQQQNMEFVKWLPHTWSDDRSRRFIGTEAGEARELTSWFEDMIEERSQMQEDELEGILPYYVIFVFDRKLLETTEMIRQMLSKKKNIHMSLVAVMEEFAELPKECRAVVELKNKNNAHLFDKRHISGEIHTFTPDIYLTADAMNLSRKLANIRLNLHGQKYVLPKMISFLEMYRVGKIEHLNSAVRWRENDPTRTLQVPVGVDTSGNLFHLDLHEKFHGPHGLVAGMTGSGKSEFIITYILSLAINFGPEEVAFVLIDYKGGGLTGAFEDRAKGIKLPHLVGTITNLDGANVQRSLISIQSELRRRQAVFNEARSISNEGTMDIYKYQRLYRQHIVSEPVPHLFIISDEFAELKMQQPEFMEQLVSAARIGRSLGVHLILATQKPAGVVDDQIWSNSRFRVCLKVQDKSDSMDMIKRPEAASLTETGRFYLQVGFNEYFELGQSAWCGAPYLPSDRMEKNVDDSILVVDRMGRAIREVKPLRRHVAVEEKQVVAIVRYLTQMADEEHIQMPNLWLPPIPAVILSDDLQKKYAYVPEAFVLNPVIGEYDDPFNQSQRLMTLPLSAEGNAMIYGSTGSGKEMLLHALIYALLKNHDVNRLNMYLLDMGAETLMSYMAAPQVGDVLLSTDAEKMKNLFRMLQEECQRRKRLFMDYGGDYSGYIKESGSELPNIVVILNNYAAFSEMFDSLDDLLTLLTREGPKYGIYFVLTVSSASGIRYRLQQNFKQMLVLQMNDITDYAGILGQTEGLVPSAITGRGLVKYDRIYEFQTASTTAGDNQVRFNRQLCRQLAENTEKKAPRVPVLPESVDRAFVEDCIHTLSDVPVGVNCSTLRIEKIPLKKRSAYYVLASDVEQTLVFAQGLAQVLDFVKDIHVTVLDGTDVFKLSETDGYVCLKDNIEEYLGKLILEVADRYNTCKAAGMDSGIMEDREEQVIVLAGLKALYDQLSDDGRDKLRLILEKGEAIHKLHYIICDSADGCASVYFDWYRKRQSFKYGIWMGEGLTAQYAFELGKRPFIEAETAPDIGYIIDKGRYRMMKCLVPEKYFERREEDDE